MGSIRGASGVVSSVFLSFAVLVSPVEGQKKSDDLAAVVMLPVEDKTGSGQFGYMPQSLAGAIADSMRQKFTYRTIPESKIKDSLARLKIKDTSEEEVVRQLAREIKVDIVIFGEFQYDQVREVLVIHLAVYYAENRRMVKLPPVVNKVDNTLFDATDQAAANIVEEVKTAVLARQETMRKEPGLHADEPAAGGKIRLTWKPRVDKRKELETMIDQGVEKHFEEIQERAASLSLHQREEIFSEKKMGPPLWPVLSNIFLGFGSGFFIQNDTTNFRIYLAVDLFAVSEIVLSLAAPGDNWNYVLFGLALLGVSRVAQALTPLVYANRYNGQLKSALLLVPEVKAWAALDDTSPVYGALVSHRF